MSGEPTEVDGDIDDNALLPELVKARNSGFCLEVKR